MCLQKIINSIHISHPNKTLFKSMKLLKNPIRTYGLTVFTYTEVQKIDHYQINFHFSILQRSVNCKVFFMASYFTVYIYYFKMQQYEFCNWKISY